MRAPSGREADLERRMVFAGGPEHVAARIVRLHKALGHSRQILQMDVGGMPHETFLRASNARQEGAAEGSAAN